MFPAPHRKRPASRRPGPRRAALLACGLGLVAAPGVASAQIDWNLVADVYVIEVVSTNADGTSKDTRVWLAVLDGRGYLRTGATGWWENIARNDEVVLRINDLEYPLRAVQILDEELMDRVEVVFRDKYGWPDALIAPFRPGERKIMRLEPR